MNSFRHLFGHNALTFKDNLYIVKRILRESDNPNIEHWKEYLDVDTVLKNDGKYFLCSIINDAEIIEETNNAIEQNNEDINNEDNKETENEEKPIIGSV